MAVAFAMIAAYILSRTLVPACQPPGSSRTRHGPRAHGHGEARRHHGPRQSETIAITATAAGSPRPARRGPSPAGSAMIDRGIAGYVSGLDVVLRHRLRDRRSAVRHCWRDRGRLMWPILRREFFPEVDAGAFEMYVRAPSGTRIEETEERIARGRGVRPRDDRRGRPAAVHLRDSASRRLVGRLHAERRPDGRRRQGAAHAGAARSRPRSTSTCSATAFAERPAVRRPGIRLRRRRHDPRGA